MKNTIKVLWYIIISTMVLTMFVFVSAKVFAHGEGKCITDVDGDVFLGDGSWVKIFRHLSIEELKKLQDGEYEHGHKNQYYDEHGNKTTLSTSFFDKDGGVDKDEFYVDCPTTTPPPPSPPPPSPPPQPTTNEGYNEDAEGFIGIVHTHGYTNQDGVARYNEHHHKNIVIVDGDYVYEDSSHHSLPVNGEGYDDLIDELEVPAPAPDPVPTPKPVTPAETLDEVKDQEPTIPDEIEAEVLDAEDIEMTDERESYDYDFHGGWNFVTFPVLPNGVETLEGLYPHLYPRLYSDPILVVYIEGCWLKYQGEGETGMIPLTVNMGVAVYAEKSFSVTIFGFRSPVSELELMLGGNFVGIPPDVERPSDLLDRAIAVLREIAGKPYLVGRLGDPGDEPFEDGESVFLIVSETAQAPMAYRASTLATSWGAMKQ